MKNARRITLLCFLSSLALQFFVVHQAFAFETLKIAAGRYVTYDVVRSTGAKDTVVLLPGINRQLQPDTESTYFSALKKQKLNVVSIASSCHPRSLAQIPEGEQFFGFKQQVTTADLAREVESVIKKLKLKNAHVVSLSYSSSILSEIDPSLVASLIETVPMADPVEGMSSQIKIIRDSQDLLKITNPFFGPGIVRAQRDTGYRTNWSSAVKSNLEANPEQYGPNPNVESIIEGYVSLARAAEDYRLTRVQLEVPRIWVLASEELEERLSSQLKAVQNDFKKFPDQVSLLLVSNSGHVLPKDQPASAAASLKKAVEMTKSQTFESGIFVGSEFQLFSEEQKRELGLN